MVLDQFTISVDNAGVVPRENTMQRPFHVLAFATSLTCAATGAQSDVVISPAQTRNVTCSGGVCAPTAKDAVLNAGDVETMLASGNLAVTSTGSGVEADNIVVKAALSWPGSNTLSLTAYDSIAVARHVSVKGRGALSLATNNGGSGGTLSFGAKGRVSFKNLSSVLRINGTKYTLVNSISLLATAIAQKPRGNYALADNYDASADGTYSNTPITTYVEGTVEGLGNTISNIQVLIASGTQFNVGGLFLVIDSGATVENLGLANLQLTMNPYERGISQNAGGLVVTNKGLIFNSHVTGSIAVDAKGSVGDSTVGGLLADGYGGTISNCFSTARVEIEFGDPGGLASGFSGGTVVGSYATGSVTGLDETGDTSLGGFTSGTNQTTITNSYATGRVEAKGEGALVGGFSGGTSTNNDSYSTSYFAGELKVKGSATLGGFLGGDYGGTFQDNYWDTTTSDTDAGTGEGNVSGITGLTTKQLQSGLPPGFDSTIWAEKKGINNGLPYLIANPPVK